jgi:hypothetical protein
MCQLRISVHSCVSPMYKAMYICAQLCESHVQSYVYLCTAVWDPCTKLRISVHSCVRPMYKATYICAQLCETRVQSYVDWVN